jgi:photosynthetic reaction center cytochrome c subunit
MGMIRIFIIIAGIFLGALFIGSFFNEKTDTVQRGYRGTAMVQLSKASQLAAVKDLHAIPEADPIDDPDPSLPSIRSKYKNVQVLDDLTVLEFSRLMNALSEWVAPEEGCTYCHNTKNMASDEKYTKLVARQMLIMTRRINNDWKSHVGNTGVTCWTCHRGKAVPSGDWYSRIDEKEVPKFMGHKRNQNTPGIATIANTSLPYDPLSQYLIRENPIRVQGTAALPTDNKTGVPNAEQTYALMLYMSKSLGINCTYCHHTQNFASWELSPPPRATAWYGIRMVRDLNQHFLIPIGGLLPDYRLGEFGDSPKVGCATCHKGAYKPLYGVSMQEDYPELWRKGGPLVKSNYVSPPLVEVINPTVPPAQLMNGKY